LEIVVMTFPSPLVTTDRENFPTVVVGRNRGKIINNSEVTSIYCKIDVFYVYFVYMLHGRLGIEITDQRNCL